MLIRALAVLLLAAILGCINPNSNPDESVRPDSGSRNDSPVPETLPAKPEPAKAGDRSEATQPSSPSESPPINPAGKQGQAQEARALPAEALPATGGSEALPQPAISAEMAAALAALPETIDNPTVRAHPDLFSGVVTIPDHVRTINSGIFYQARITGLIIGSGVARIGVYAFSECPITSLEIRGGDNALRIENSAFRNASLAGQLTIPGRVTEIANEAFLYRSGDGQITSLVIAEGVEIIGDWVFYGHEIGSLDLPDSLVSIGNGAFNENVITNITMSSNVQTWYGESRDNRNQGDWEAHIRSNAPANKDRPDVVRHPAITFRD